MSDRRDMGGATSGSARHSGFAVGRRTVQPTKHSSVTAGECVELFATGDIEGCEFRIFVRQDEVDYLTPLRDWSAQPAFSWMTSAPGKVEIRFERRRAGGLLDWASTTLQVDAGEDLELEPTPRRIELEDGTRLWVPSAWESRRFGRPYEGAALAWLRSRASTAKVAYDLGANIGFFALRLARWLEPAGQLYCFEANPLCVYFLRANLFENRIDNCTILPVAVGSAPVSFQFALDYANTSIGTTSDSPHFTYKTGQAIGVQAVRIDDLVADGRLRRPNLMKIDVEGSEITVLDGMRETLARDRPDLLVEVHGLSMASGVIALLGEIGYRFRLLDQPGTDDWLAEAAILPLLTEAVYPLVCTKP
jgi:FkbM family methyltransferase